MLEFCKTLPEGWSVVCTAEKWFILDEDGSVIVDADNPSEMLCYYTMYCRMREEWYRAVQKNNGIAIEIADLLYGREPAEA